MCKGTGLKPVAFKLWVNRVQQIYGSQQSAPPRLVEDAEVRHGVNHGRTHHVRRDAAPEAHHVPRAVAAQVAFCESKGLKTSFSRDGLKPGAFKLWVNCIQFVQPHRGRGGRGGHNGAAHAPQALRLGASQRQPALAWRLLFLNRDSSLTEDVG
jgi:hypothetical protein